MRKAINKRIKGTVKAVCFSGVCCTVIYASMLMIAAKSIMNVQANPVDM